LSQAHLAALAAASAAGCKPWERQSPNWRGVNRQSGDWRSRADIQKLDRFMDLENYGPLAEEFRDDRVKT